MVSLIIAKLSSSWQSSDSWTEIVTFYYQLWALLRAQKIKIMRKSGIHSSVPLFAKLSFNFNHNLVESWDGYILNFPSHPPPIQRSTKWPLLQLLNLTTTSTITSIITELGTAQPQLVFSCCFNGVPGMFQECKWMVCWLALLGTHV